MQSTKKTRRIQNAGSSGKMERIPAGLEMKMLVREMAAESCPGEKFFAEGIASECCTGRAVKAMYRFLTVYRKVC